MNALLDTGFLLAILDADDDLHEACVEALGQEDQLPGLPDVVLPELAYMVLRELGYPALVDFLRALLEGQIPIVKVELDDLARTAQILDKFQDSRVDFVDCALVAVAERLKISKILTVDRRHFGLFRPPHCKNRMFEILP